jgi:transcriptional regulator with GAF, ATPase, and Fis domain
MQYRMTAQVFVELADTLVADFDVIELLQTLAERAVDLLDVDAAGILLADQRGALTLVAASSDEVRVLELFQLQDQDGPCLDCFRSGEKVTCADLSADPQQWPRFATAARAVGLTAVHAFPLRLRDQVLGAMNLFTTAAGSPSDDTTSIAQALADVATIGILNERTLRQQQLITEQLQYALNSRIIIEQAKGMLAERGQMSISDAFTLLRAYARDQNRQLSTVAREVLDKNTNVAERIVADANLRKTKPQK